MCAALAGGVWLHGAVRRHLTSYGDSRHMH